MEADSELMGALDVCPANGEEGANAPSLLTSEEPAHGNAIASLSLDCIGYRGALLAQGSEAANRPQLTVSVPPLDWRPPAPELFHPPAFLLNDARDEVRCPGGATPRHRKRAERGHGWRFAFSIPQCRAGLVRAQGVKPDAQRGRPVITRDYEAQYPAARQRAQTAEYHAVRREHPRSERKLAELIRWHAGRRVRYRGRLRVKIQYVLTAIGVNCKRMVKLLSLPRQP
jgi:Transposase DDE domain